MKNTITYTKQIPLLKKIFGICILLLSLYIFWEVSIVLSFFTIAFGLFLSATTGSQFNIDRNTYREIWSLFGLHFGKWLPNPGFDYISVFRGKEKQRINSRGSSISSSNEIFYVNIFDQRNRKKTFYKSYDKEDAFEVAKHFRLALAIDILDATGEEQIWLEDN